MQIYPTYSWSAFKLMVCVRSKDENLKSKIILKLRIKIKRVEYRGIERFAAKEKTQYRG